MAVILRPVPTFPIIQTLASGKVLLSQYLAIVRLEKTLPKLRWLPLNEIAENWPPRDYRSHHHFRFPQNLPQPYRYIQSVPNRSLLSNAQLNNQLSRDLH